MDFWSKALESEKKTFEVNIAGLPLKLRSSHDLNTVQELIDLVNEKVEAASQSNSQPAFQKALLLACLHMAEDYVLLKRTAVRELNHLENKANQIFLDLESSPLSRIRLDN